MIDKSKYGPPLTDPKEAAELESVTSDSPLRRTRFKRFCLRIWPADYMLKPLHKQTRKRRGQRLPLG